MSCSDDSDNVGSTLNSPLKGIVFGENFEAKGGRVFISGDDLSINITNVAVDCSSDIFDYILYVSTTVDNKTGTTNKANVVFGKKGETPLNVLQSTVIIEFITESEIVVKIKASSSGNDIIEGIFTVPFCK